MRAERLLNRLLDDLHPVTGRAAGLLAKRRGPGRAEVVEWAERLRRAALELEREVRR